MSDVSRLAATLKLHEEAGLSAKDSADVLRIGVLAMRTAEAMTPEDVARHTGIALVDVQRLFRLPTQLFFGPPL